MDTFGAIRAAIDRSAVVDFDYPTATLEGLDMVRRTFSPFEIAGESVIGWDHGRDELRRYRFDRMARLTDNPDAEYVRPT